MLLKFIIDYIFIKIEDINIYILHCYISLLIHIYIGIGYKMYNNIHNVELIKQS